MSKIAIVTGAARRIGEAIARTLHKNNFNVVVHYHSSEKPAAALVAELCEIRKNSAIQVSGDLSGLECGTQLVNTATEKFGGLDLLVNCASIYETSNVSEPDLGQWDAIFNTNLRGPYLLCSAALEQLKERRGNIINITDIYALRPQAGHPVYCASKAALLGLTKALAVDLAPSVRVNAIAPGPILWAEKNDPSYKNIVLAKTPLGKLGGADAIADAVVYLANADFVTGEVVHVDGGRQLHI